MLSYWYHHTNEIVHAVCWFIARFNCGTIQRAWASGKKFPSTNRETIFLTHAHIIVTITCRL